MDYPYEASDEASESELLDKSLSMWRGWGTLGEDPAFQPTPLDLHTAASIGMYDCVSAYIASGEVDINRRNRGGWTPLMYASYIGQDNVVNLLLDAGAQADLRNEKGATALMLTASCGNESVAYFLVQHGAELENRDDKGWTTLFYATYAGHQKVVQFLLDNGANVNAREPRLGITPFMMAAAEGHEIIVNLLLEHGVNVNLRSSKGETARSLAQLNGHMKIIGLIDGQGVAPCGLRSEPAHLPAVDLSSSDESYQRPNRPHARSGRSKTKGPSIRDGPETLAKLLSERKGGRQGTILPSAGRALPGDYVAYQFEADQSAGRQLKKADAPAPPSQEEATSSRVSGNGNIWLNPFPPRYPAANNDDNEDDPAFCISGALPIKSSNSSNCSGGGGVRGVVVGGVRGGVVGGVGGGARGGGGAFAAALAVSSGSHSSADEQSSSEASSYSLPPTPSSNSSESAGFAGALSDQLSQMISADLARRGFGPADPLHTAEHRAPAPAGPLHTSHPHPHSRQPASANGIGYHSSVLPLSPCDVPQDAPYDRLAESHPYPYQDLGGLLESLGLRTKYFHVFEEQDVDLRVFLTLTDSDLKEVGIKLMGPRRKMTNAIARWHSQARPFLDSLEQVYADRVETAMQEMAVQLQEAMVKKGEVEAQVMQERELRGVVEGCLVEDRRTYQQLLNLVSEARKLCHNMRQLYDSVRSCQTELIRRLQAYPAFVIPKDVRLGSLPKQFAAALQVDLPPRRGGEEPSPSPSPPPAPDQNPLVSAITSSLITGDPPRATGAGQSPVGTSQDGGDELAQLTTKDLLGMLSQGSHQLGRAVAMATNNMDQLIDGQTANFSPNSSGNSLP